MKHEKPAYCNSPQLYPTTPTRSEKKISRIPQPNSTSTVLKSSSESKLLNRQNSLLKFPSSSFDIGLHSSQNSRNGNSAPLLNLADLDCDEINKTTEPLKPNLAASVTPNSWNPTMTLSNVRHESPLYANRNTRKHGHFPSLDDASEEDSFVENNSKVSPTRPNKVSPTNNFPEIPNTSSAIPTINSETKNPTPSANGNNINGGCTMGPKTPKKNDKISLSATQRIRNGLLSSSHAGATSASPGIVDNNSSSTGASIPKSVPSSMKLSYSPNPTRPTILNSRKTIEMMVNVVMELQQEQKGYTRKIALIEAEQKKQMSSSHQKIKQIQSNLQTVIEERNSCQMKIEEQREFISALKKQMQELSYSQSRVTTRKLSDDTAVKSSSFVNQIEENKSSFTTANDVNKKCESLKACIIPHMVQGGSITPPVSLVESKINDGTSTPRIESASSSISPGPPLEGSNISQFIAPPKCPSTADSTLIDPPLVFPASKEEEKHEDTIKNVEVNDDNRAKELHRILISFYEEYDSSKIRNVPRYVRSYTNKEMEFLHNIKKKYGPKKTTKFEQEIQLLVAATKDCSTNAANQNEGALLPSSVSIRQNTDEVLKCSPVSNNNELLPVKFDGNGSDSEEDHGNHALKISRNNSLTKKKKKVPSSTPREKVQCVGSIRSQIQAGNKNSCSSFPQVPMKNGRSSEALDTKDHSEKNVDKKNSHLTDVKVQSIDEVDCSTQVVKENKVLDEDYIIVAAPSEEKKEEQSSLNNKLFMPCPSPPPLPIPHPVPAASLIGSSNAEIEDDAVSEKEPKKVASEAKEKKVNLKELLLDFYTKHQPDKLKNVPELARSFSGKERELVGLLKKRYGAMSVKILEETLVLFDKQNVKQLMKPSAISKKLNKSSPFRKAFLLLSNLLLFSLICSISWRSYRCYNTSLLPSCQGVVLSERCMCTTWNQLMRRIKTKEGQSLENGRLFMQIIVEKPLSQFSQFVKSTDFMVFSPMIEVDFKLEKHHLEKANAFGIICTRSAVALKELCTQIINYFSKELGGPAKPKQENQKLGGDEEKIVDETEKTKDQEGTCTKEESKHHEKVEINLQKDDKPNGEKESNELKLDHEEVEKNSIGEGKLDDQSDRLILKNTQNASAPKNEGDDGEKAFELTPNRHKMENDNFDEKVKFSDGEVEKADDHNLHGEETEKKNVNVDVDKMHDGKTETKKVDPGEHINEAKTNNLNKSDEVTSDEIGEGDDSSSGNSDESELKQHHIVDSIRQTSSTSKDEIEERENLKFGVELNALLDEAEEEAARQMNWI